MTWGQGRNDPPEGIHAYRERLHAEGAQQFTERFPDPWPELDPRTAVDFLRERVAEQLRDDPGGPTLLDAIETARDITKKAEEAKRWKADRQFWDIVQTG